MLRLEDLTLFVCSAALGSFFQRRARSRSAARQVSAAIQRLERELDLRLFVRSTAACG